MVDNFRVDFKHFNSGGLGAKVCRAMIMDLMFVFAWAAKRELKLLNAMLMVKTTLWKTMFGKEADKKDPANNEKEPLINAFISVPKAYGIRGLSWLNVRNQYAKQFCSTMIL